MKQRMIKFRINNNRHRSYHPLLLSLLCLFFVHSNGFSEIYSFDYAADCKTVQTIGSIYESGHVNITWQDVGAAEYTAEYRKKGSSKWYTGSIVQPGLCPVYNLQFGKEYEYRIGSRCVANDIFQYSAIKAIQIPDKADKGPNCGIMPDSKIANKVPAQQLQHGLPVLAGDFPVFITKIEGSGHFSGEGYVGIPYLSNLQVAVTFKDIVVNTDNKLISGYFETKYDPVNNMIFDVDKTLTGGKGVGDIRSGEEKASYTVNYSINPNLQALPVKADGTKDEITEGSDYTFTKGENGKYTFILTDSEGKEHKLETDTVPATIQDKNGNTFEINDKGNIAPISGKTDIHLDDATKNKPHPEIATLSFETTKNTKYAVDSYKEVYAKVTEFFLKYKPSNEDMIASAKFMTPGSSDEIFVKVETSSEKFNPEKVHFITDKGKEYQGKYDGSTGWTLTVLGSAPDDGQHLYVVQEESPGKYATLARLNIYSYEPKNLAVRLVPVNGFDNNFNAQELTNQLNAIYSKVGISCEVILDDSFDYAPMQGKTFNTSGSGLFSKLTDDMKALTNAYKESFPNSAEDACLFILDNVTSDDGVKGEMPRAEHFGYLFSRATAQTIAHEIGHGIFHLDHPFDRANAQKSFASGDLAGNVMEYPPHDGQGFVKLQWDAMHATGIVIGVFEKDKGGMIATNARSIVEGLKANIGCGAISSPFDNGKAKEIIDMLIVLSNTYKAGKKMSTEECLKYMKEKNVIGEIELYFTEKNVNYCIDDIAISVLESTKKQIDLSNRTIIGTDTESYITFDDILRITFKEDSNRSMDVAKYYAEYAFGKYDDLYYDKSYTAGIFINDASMNEDQKEVIKYFINTKEGDEFIKQFAKNGDVILNKKYTEDGWFYKKYGIGLVLQSSGKANYSYYSHASIENKKHFTMALTTSVDSINIRVGLLENLLHECFIHGYMNIEDYSDDLKINSSNISNDAQKSSNGIVNVEYPVNHYQHIEATENLLRKYKDKAFNLIPKTYIWPSKAFEILKNYTNGMYDDYRIIHEMFYFSGSRIKIVLDNKKNAIIKAKYEYEY